jgi:1,4-alpha-glucan branching enzyme
LWQLDSDPQGFRWINADDAGSDTFSWVRADATGQQVAVLVNFSAEPWTSYRIGLPDEGVWTEIFNSDSGIYDGTDNFGNLGRVVAKAEPLNGFPASATVVVPPLGAVYLRHDPEAS